MRRPWVQVNVRGGGRIGTGPVRADRVITRGAKVYNRNGRYLGQPYLHAEVVAVHIHGCAACRHGKKYGPCDCGAQKLFDKWLETA